MLSLAAPRHTKTAAMTVAYHSTSGTSPINPTYNTMWPPSYKLFYKPHISIINHLVIVGVVCTNLYSYRKRGPTLNISSISVAEPKPVLRTPRVNPRMCRRCWFLPTGGSRRAFHFSNFLTARPV